MRLQKVQKALSLVAAMMGIWAVGITNAVADIYKCTGTNGKVAYQDEPCSVGRENNLDHFETLDAVERNRKKRAAAREAALRLEEQASRAKAAEVGLKAQIDTEKESKETQKTQPPPLVAQGRTIPDFESSTFYKKETLVRKAPAYDLRTGGKNNAYSFKDSENSNSSFGVELTTNGQQIVEVGIHWNGQSNLRPAKMSPRKVEQLKELAAFWGVAGQAKAIVEYAESQQQQNYPDGSSQAPRKSLGPIAIHVGTTGGTLWIGWTALAAPPTAATQNNSANANKPASVVVGTPADTVLVLRGKAVAIRQVGNDGNGLLVEWEYPDATYLMGRQEKDGVIVYRVIKIQPRK